MRFSDLCPDDVTRSAVTRIFADSIRSAHHVNLAGWSISAPSGKPRINLVSGRIFVLSLGEDGLWVTVDMDQLNEEARTELSSITLEGPSSDFASVPSARSYRVAPSSLDEAWPQLEAAHRSVVEFAAETVSRTPYFKSYAPELIDDLESETEDELPRPDFGIEGGLTEARAQRLVDLVRHTYPDWSGFDDARFEEDEVHYKQEVVQEAATKLSREELAGLLDSGDYDEFIGRLDTIGKETNLLYLSVPSSGDLNILYRDDLPRESFCEAVFDLLHGDGDGADRFARYLAWISDHDIPRSHNKWTFPTYFLLFCHPEEEMLVKPSYVRDFIKLGGFDFKLGSGPSGDTYAAIRGAYQELGDKLEEYGPRDMVDLQGFVWVAVRASREVKKQREQIDAAREEFKRLQEDPEFRFRVAVRHYRSLQLQDLLSDLEAVTLEMFNREVWRILSSASIGGRDVSGLFRRFDLDEAEAQLLLDAIENESLELHGNAMWGSGSKIFGPALRLSYDGGTPLSAVVGLLEDAGGSLEMDELLAQASSSPAGAALTADTVLQLVTENRPYLRYEDGEVRRVPDEHVREGYVREAVRVLNDPDLEPGDKAEQLMEIPGFGPNTATGLVMAFHPEEFGIYNGPSRNALERLGFDAKNVPSFEESLTQLKEEFEARDYFELDQFLWMFDSGLVKPHRSGLWWVNQGQTYEEERRLGCVWAGMAGDGKPKVRHHTNVSRLIPGDHVIHYVSGAIRAVGTVTNLPSERSKDATLGPDENNPVGHFAPIDYAELDEPIELDGIPKEWRKSEGGPFNRNGGVKQGYLYPITSEFAGRLRERFQSLDELLPALRKSFWLFQANPKYYELEKELESTSVGSEGDWYVPRYADEMEEGDHVYLWQSGERAGLYATGRITGPIFKAPPSEWMDEDGPVDRVPFVYERILETPIPRDEIVGDPVLSGMQIIKAPQGTNFKVNAEEHRRLQEILDGARPIGFDEIVERIDRAGMRINEDVLRRYHLALQTRGFVILAGLSGSGKTWLTQLYAEATGARSKLIPVAPNWTTNEDLLGYFNPITQQYHDTPFSRFLRDAAAEYERATSAGETPTAFHVTLDEMDLARIEYYFARFLSAMEIRARQGTATIELGPEDTVTLPPNLYFVGTVNIDETTHGFADKVYDRAQLIELEAPRALLVEHLGDLNYADTLMDIWDAVAEVSPFAFRVLDEIEVYVTAAEEYGVHWHDALDEQVVQKVLPKLKGGDPRIGQALEAVMHVAEGTLPLTHAKASKMADALRDYGFTSYF